MKFFTKLLRALKPAKPGTGEIKQLGEHTLRDIGIDPIASQYHRDAHHWQQLAA